MADIKLTNLGDIPVVEPDDSTHLLAEQDGAYARVPKDKVGVTRWNELQDQPFYSNERLKVAHPGMANTHWYKVSADVPAENVTVGSKCVAKMSTSDSLMTGTVVLVGEDYYIATEGLAVVALTDGVELAELGNARLPERGTYFLKSPSFCAFGFGVGDEITITWDGNAEEIKQLDPKFIPSNAVCLGETTPTELLNAMTNSEKTGNPVIWEGHEIIGHEISLQDNYAHLLFSATSDVIGSEPYYREYTWTDDTATISYYDGIKVPKMLVVASSTAGSTKQFKITVDDSGTLSAVQI